MPDPENCANYFRCVLGELKREQCAPGLHWDASRGICDWPAAAKCQAATGNAVYSYRLQFIRTEARYSSMNIDREEISVFCSVVRLDSTTHKPSWTTTVTSTTSRKPTTSFSWTSSEHTTRHPSTQSPTTTEHSILRPGKSCEHGQYYPYPNSCTNFLVCVNGDLISQQCGPGLNWNRDKSMCDWAFKNPCVEKPMKSASLIAAGGKSTVSSGKHLFLRSFTLN